MVTALHLVVRIPLCGGIAIVDGPLDGQSPRYQVAVGVPLPDHVTGHLVLESRHALVEVTGIHLVPLPARLFEIPIGTGKGAHEKTRLARFGIVASLCVDRLEGPDIGGEVICPERLQGAHALVLGKDAWQADLKGPTLAEHLVDLATGSRVDRCRMSGIDLVLKVLPVKEIGRLVRSPSFRNLPATGGKGRILHGVRHDRR